jgi:hypothetical protein
MTFDFPALLDAAVSKAQSLGLFEKVNGHEPKTAPGKGLQAAVWVQDLSPIQSSGLAATSGRVEISVRIYTNMLAEPQDGIDPRVLTAVAELIGAYTSDFEVGDLAGVRGIDLLGAYGTPLSAKAGYLNQDGKLYRVMTITLPVIVNDLWVQAA